MSTINNDSGISVAASPGAAARRVDCLSAELPLSSALEVIFRQRWESVLRHLPLAAENVGQNVEHVHKLRVSSRRLSAVLDVLATEFPELALRPLFRLIERIRRTCGKARDLDVRRKFLETLLPQASIEDATAIELLCEQFAAQRARAQKKLRRKLPKLGRRLHAAGEKLLASLACQQMAEQGGGVEFGQTAGQILRKELSVLWGQSDEDLESVETLHQLRIACKHVRYAFEVFLPTLHDSFPEEFYPQLERVQDLLGAVHDATQATRVVRRRRKKWKRGLRRDRGGDGRLTGFHWRELRPGLDCVLLAYAQQADQARGEFLDLWPDFAGNAFRTPVEDLLSSMASLPSGDAR